MAASTRHETRALLRAHLSAASCYPRHLTRHCPICHRLLRLAMASARTPPSRLHPLRTSPRTRPRPRRDLGNVNCRPVMGAGSRVPQ
ncbi:DUF6274 family protein [Streptomyces sp. MS1.AVA.1]|uniref:DUF6274 family protein n=1 Tax=Streptomyces machairae TaxID=3134109 RepID=A0ABU8UM84_9ACTN